VRASTLTTNITSIFIVMHYTLRIACPNKNNTL
jgi:hypothetical protein